MATGTDAVKAGSPLTATGAISSAVKGTTVPTDALTKLNVAFKKLGYIGEDGVSRATDRNTEKIKAWGGSTVKVMVTDTAITYSFTFLESANAEVLKAVYGEDNVKVTAPDGTNHKGKVAITHNNTVPAPAAYTIDMLDGATFMREVIPNGQLSVSGDVSFAASDVIRYEIEIEALVDESGNFAYSYQDEAVDIAKAKTALGA